MRKLLYNINRNLRDVTHVWRQANYHLESIHLRHRFEQLIFRQRFPWNLLWTVSASRNLRRCGAVLYRRTLNQFKFDGATTVLRVAGTISGLFARIEHKVAAPASIFDTSTDSCGYCTHKHCCLCAPNSPPPFQY